MARIFVALNNFCRIEEDYTAMPPFFESFIQGLSDAGNDVRCYQTKSRVGSNRFSEPIPIAYVKMLREFQPDLCIFFNNNFWDVSDIVNCPIIIYDVDSPLEWQLKDQIKKKIDRYLFVYNQSKGYEALCEYFNASRKQCCYIPFFSEIRADQSIIQDKQIVFLGTNWIWKGYSVLNEFIQTNPSASDIKKAIDVLQRYTQEPLKSSGEIYDELENCPHDRIDFGDPFRFATETSGYRRLRYLEAVSDLGLEISGYYWNIDAMNYFPQLLACVRNRQIWTKKDSQAFYNSAKIAMSTKHIQAADGFSFRVCDILASNACLLTERSDDIKRLFPKVDIPVFTSPMEAREQCKRLIQNENLRRDIVCAAHEAIDQGFRFKHVLEKLEAFTGLQLHTENEGQLSIFPKSEEVAVDLTGDQSSEQGLSKIQLRYYNTLGKHLGYDPYNLFPKRMYYLGKIPVMKMLTVSEKRKELYIGCLPILSCNISPEKTVMRNLFLEKTGNAFRKLKNRAKADETRLPNVFKKKTIAKAQRKKHIKEKLITGEKIKVCLFVSRINCWMFDGLYKLLEESGKFEPVIVIKPFLSRGKEHMKECMSSTYEELKARGYTPIKGYDEKTDTYLDVKREIDPDIVFYTKFWKPHFHENFYIDAFRDRITLLIDYGYNVTGHTEAMDFELQNDVDIYFYYSPIQKEIAARYMRNRAKNVYISGAPKLDCFFDPNYQPKDVWKKQEKSKKRIIWAPHHEDKTGPSMYQFDAFYDLYEIMFEIAERYHDEIQIAFKPHPLLKVKLYKYWGKTATDKYYQRWAELENGQLEEGAFIDLFSTSDAMILDSLSFIAEYAATNKPALFTVGAHSRVLLNDMGYQLYDRMYHAKEHLKEEIQAFLEDVVINGHDTLQEEREKYIRENIRPPYGKLATQNVYDAIVNYIKNEGDIKGIQ